MKDIKLLFFDNSKEDTQERAYRIKNFMKKLFTYKVLNEKDTNRITSKLCPRCEKEEETWEHIWICAENELSLREMIEEGIETVIIKMKSKEEEEMKRKSK
ncbi:hypothetical protein GLOIN_2v1827388 [Rhizophagus clarus]|uniref:Uncharacterized protein n=1 Tax=Rhizophagus clarus TaxID=94130 RepID=A0A8H3QPN2_9GLOM|nr:hypothetical protein GLOIN_2v1827388 [Rhizophagus clarus]